MVPTVLLSVAIVVVVLGLLWAVLRRDHVDETERFHRASQITSSWAAPGPSTHPGAGGASAPLAQPEPGVERPGG